LRRILARQVALNSFILLIASFLIGHPTFAFLLESPFRVQVGGGPDRPFPNGWTMLKKQRGNGPRPDVRKK